jgi:phosphate transport system substrate-binding protein
MSPLLAELAAAFHEQSPMVSVEVTGLGTRYGLESLRAGEAEMAMASWLPPELSGQNPDRPWRATAIARDGIAVIVHPENQVEGLGLLQLRDLFGGRIETWEGVGGRAREGQVQPVSREEGSGTRAAFEALVMEDQRVTPLAVVVPSSQAVVDYVAQHPGAIGYVSMGSVSPGVKALKLEGEAPTPEGAAKGSYALTHELWLVTADPPAAAVQDFLDFILSPAGQQIVGRRYGRIK